MISKDVERLCSFLDDALYVVIFTGAGISTDSGIPDFRSPNGLWQKNKPIDFNEFLRSEEIRRENWRRKIEIDKSMQAATPNQGHYAIATLAQGRQGAMVITQNIDGLHQKSGMSDEQVIELHGNSTYATCLECGTRYELEAIKAAFICDDILPICNHCGGIVKQATISFGQPMPSSAMRRAKSATMKCDLFIVIGSSLVVYPAATFPIMAKHNGSALVILNREPTKIDCFADLIINDEISPTLSATVSLIK